MADTDKKFLDEDGVSQFAEETKKYVDKHADNADIHVTAADKVNWNGKQDALTAEQLEAVNSGLSATDKGNYDAHIADDDIHVTADDKANWNAKQDALTSQQIDNINDVVNKANDADVVHKTGDETVNGVKTFTASPFVSNYAATNGFFTKLNIVSRTETPSQICHSAFRVFDKDSKVLGEYCVEKSSSGSSLLHLDVHTEDSSGNDIMESLYLNLNKDGSIVSFYPSQNDRMSSGTTACKWKDVNTVLLNGKTPAYTDDLESKADKSDLNNYLPKHGGDLNGPDIQRDTNDSFLRIRGGKDSSSAHLFLVGKNRAGDGGNFALVSANGSSSYELLGKPNGTLTWSGKNIDVIEEQGDGYIRYSNGIQICWGAIVTQTQLMPITFGKAFLSSISYCVAVCPSFNTRCWLTGDRTATNITLTTESGDGSHRRVDWQAIGKWK